MALWMVVVLSLCGLLRGYEALSMQSCCEDGRDRALSGKHCAFLPNISSSVTCSMTQQLCCVSTLEENYCTRGINLALQQWGCEMAFLPGNVRQSPAAQILKKCCECCLLNQMAAEEGLSCDMSAVLLKYCGTAAEVCCRKKTVHNVNPDAGDIDECAMKTHNCTANQTCINRHGSFHCKPQVKCSVGFTVSTDGACIDIDECAQGDGKGPCSYGCTNEDGSFSCFCPSGYKLSPNKHSCEDIDECEAGTNNCSMSNRCFNVGGGYRCLSPQCPPKYKMFSLGPVDSVNYRCVKACLPYDNGCTQNPVHRITFWSLNLPYFKKFKGKREIMFLRTTVPTNSSSLQTDFKMAFDSGCPRCFDVVKSLEQNTITGVIRQVKHISGPRDVELGVTILYLQPSNVTHQDFFVIRIFIPPFAV